MSPELEQPSAPSGQAPCTGTGVLVGALVGVLDGADAVFVGVLQGAEAGRVNVECDGQVIALALDDLERAKLVPAL